MMPSPLGENVKGSQGGTHKIGMAPSHPWLDSSEVVVHLTRKSLACK